MISSIVYAQNAKYTLEFDKDDEQLVEVKIIDMNGQELYSKQIDAAGKIHEKIESNIENEGVYILQISQGMNSLSKKLIVE